jgi:pilus assembly protein CpaF
MSPQRLSGIEPRENSCIPALEKTQPSVDMLKIRLLIMLNEKFDAAKLQRMPASLVRETARRQLRQTLEREGPPLPAADRDRFIDEVLGEAFALGPLEELFADPTVIEIAIVSPYAVIVRRDDGWQATHVTFRDIEHVQEILDKIRARGDPVGGPLPESMFDVRLNNGFRAVAVVPVSSMGVSPTAAFVRAGDLARS